MSVVGIIAEYNPFHSGHKLQLEKIKERFGEDTVTVAVMSGQFTQRAEPAAFDKVLRARAAVLCGIDLVLELPFPFCMSSAEIFASAGVDILNSLGVVDYLSFGSECGDIDLLKKAADALSSDTLPKEECHDSRGYAARCEEISEEAGLITDGVFSSNNILGIEYIKAIKRLESSIIPTTVKREGASYTSENLADNTNPSAMAIRSALALGDHSALDFIQKEAKDIFSDALIHGEGPTSASRLDSAVISSFRLNSPNEIAPDVHDAGGGLYNRLRSASFGADSISSLIELTKTKKYTTARIRRAIWYSFFGVTSSEAKARPAYTQVLAMTQSGAALLKRIKKTTNFPILTKPSATSHLSGDALAQKMRSDRAESVFQLAKPSFVRADAGRLFTPFVKK